MVTVDKVDINSKAQVKEFVDFHFNLYKGCPQWVPPFREDIRIMMNPNKHPFYEHSEAEFYIAHRDGEVVGTISALENKPFNKYHGTKEGVFYNYDTINDREVSDALFARVFEWCHKRGLDTVIGPKGFGPFDGYGIQVEGYQHRRMMNMMNYNYDYYPKLVEALGFEKEVDFVSTYLNKDKFTLPEKIYEIARRVQERGKFKIVKFKDKNDLRKAAYDVGQAYNESFIYNWEYYPLTRNEIKFNMDNMMPLLDPQLVKVITYDDKYVGFLLGFPDISAAMQRHGGNVSMSRPWTIADILLEINRTKWISLNGAGVLPDYQGRGGNALMYVEMANTLKNFHFVDCELTQVAETTKQMRADLKNANSEEYKNHRVYHRKI